MHEGFHGRRRLAGSLVLHRVSARSGARAHDAGGTGPRAQGHYPDPRPSPACGASRRGHRAST